jgi:hypothetical protein
VDSELHQLQLEPIPGGAKKDLSAAQAKALLTTVRPRDVAGKTRRRVAAELIPTWSGSTPEPLSDLVYRQLLTDALNPAVTGLGGQPGNDSDSSAADSHPAIDSSDQPLLGPARTQPKTPLLAAS